MSTPVSDYRMVPLVQGYPGKSTEHGGLGWSSVTLLIDGDRIVLVDTGGFGMRSLLASRLTDREIDPGDVTDILLTHAHYDHAANYLLFPHAKVWISAAELEWAAGVGASFTPLPELYAADLATRAHRIEQDGEFLPGIEAFAAPGHTPGCVVYRAAAGSGPILFTGDAAKNRAELISGEVDMSLDRQASGESVRRIRRLWQESDATLLVPGHDLPMRWAGECPHYEGTRKAGIRSWFADALSDTTHFNLTDQGTR